METCTRILVADARTTIQRLLTNVLPRFFPEEPKIELAPDPAKALGLCESRPFDLVLFGKGFESLDASEGFAIVGAAKSLQDRRGLEPRFCLLTDMSDNPGETAYGAIDLGADDALVLAQLGMNAPSIKSALERKIVKLAANRVMLDVTWEKALSSKEKKTLDGLRKTFSVSRMYTFKWAAAVLSGVVDAAAKRAPIRYDLLVKYLPEILIAACVDAEMRAPLIEMVGFPRLRHSSQVALFAQQYARKCEFGRSDRIRLTVTSLLHDIGWMQIDTSMLSGDGEWDGEQCKEMQKHAERGAWVLHGHVPQAIVDAVEQHHERFDGSGYPYGLKNEPKEKGVATKEKEEISPFGRIIGVLDTFEAQIFTRQYREITKVSIAEAIRNLKEPGVSGQVLYDPAIVQRFEAMYCSESDV